MQKLASRYLEMALGQLQGQRARLSEKMQDIMESPVELASKFTQELTRQNVDWMSQLQDTFLAAMNPSGRDEDSSED